MHVETPVFFLNSKYDPWQMRAILGIRCEYNVGCPAHQERAYVQYGQSMVRSLKILPEKHGYFVSNCIRHCMAGSRGSWNIMTIDNVKLKDAFLMWYENNIDVSGSNHTVHFVDTGDIEPSGTNRC
eukprot:4130071-Ditylum_brightwellii.AAC.1